jgi:hypothetical protein
MVPSTVKMWVVIVVFVVVAVVVAVVAVAASELPRNRFNFRESNRSNDLKGP